MIEYRYWTASGFFSLIIILCDIIAFLGNVLQSWDITHGVVITKTVCGIQNSEQSGGTAAVLIQHQPIHSGRFRSIPQDTNTMFPPDFLKNSTFFFLSNSFVRNSLVEETEAHVLVGLLYFGKPVSIWLLVKVIVDMTASWVRTSFSSSFSSAAAATGAAPPEAAGAAAAPPEPPDGTEASFEDPSAINWMCVSGSIAIFLGIYSSIYGERIVTTLAHCYTN